MGDWTIVISGTGVHHNNADAGPFSTRLGLEEDADQRMLEFADRLARDGHIIKQAAIIHGGGADTISFTHRDGRLVPEEYVRADGTRETAVMLLGIRKDRRSSQGAPAL